MFDCHGRSSSLAYRRSLDRARAVTASLSLMALRRSASPVRRTGRPDPIANTTPSTADLNVVTSSQLPSRRSPDGVNRLLRWSKLSSFVAVAPSTVRESVTLAWSPGTFVDRNRGFVDPVGTPLPPVGIRPVEIRVAVLLAVGPVSTVTTG